MIVLRSNKKHVARVWFEIVYRVCLTENEKCIMNFKFLGVSLEIDFCSELWRICL